MTTAHYVEITYANGSRVLSGPFLTKQAANRAMVRMIKTDSKITDAKIVER